MVVPRAEAQGREIPNTGPVSLPTSIPTITDMELGGGVPYLKYKSTFLYQNKISWYRDTTDTFLRIQDYCVYTKKVFQSSLERLLQFPKLFTFFKEHHSKGLLTTGAFVLKFCRFKTP